MSVDRPFCLTVPAGRAGGSARLPMTGVKSLTALNNQFFFWFSLFATLTGISGFRHDQTT